jgi:hypothetical protein
LIQSPPKIMAKPPGGYPPRNPHRMIKFGSFSCATPASSDSLVPCVFVGDKFDFHLERHVLRGSNCLSDAMCTAKSPEVSMSHSNLDSFLKCSCCLAVGHLRSDCRNKIRCLACHNYGHVKRKCLTMARTPG